MKQKFRVDIAQGVQPRNAKEKIVSARNFF